jgi:MIP family channel proteins
VQSSHHLDLEKKKSFKFAASSALSSKKFISNSLFKMSLTFATVKHKVPFFDYYLPEYVEFGKFKFLLGEDYNNRNFKRACLAEFIAMMFFVVMCCGCAMVTLNLSNPNLMMVAMSFGFGILVLAQFVGPLSGGHINCAVSFALFLGGRVSFVRCACYTGSQMLGSVLGAFFLWAIFGNHWPAARAFGSNSWDEAVFTGGQVFLAEMIGTMLLVYNVFATIDIPAAGGGPLGVFPIAMSVMVSHLFLLPIDGCSINPTRSFGPSLVAAMAGIGGRYYHQQYMFWFGPLIGAAITAIIYGNCFYFFFIFRFADLSGLQNMPL